jgi:putative DNA primase/helicase
MEVELAREDKVIARFASRKLMLPHPGTINTPDSVQQPKWDEPAEIWPRVQLVNAADITPEAIKWLWNGWLARGKLHMLAGAPGTGKTTLSLSLAATLTTNGRWPDGTRSGGGSVLIWSGEDTPEDVLVPRLAACGANLSRIAFVGRTMDGDQQSRPFDPSTDLCLLLLAIVERGGFDFLIVDPVVSAVAGDSHKNTEVRRSLQPLVDLAAKAGCAVLGISHFSKGTAGRDPVERVTGSVAFGALPRIVMATAKLPDESGGGRMLARAKSNIGPDTGAYKYDMTQVELAKAPGVFASQIVWGEALEGSARELLNQAEQEEAAEQGGVDEAEDLLNHALKDGRVSSRDVKALAKGERISDKSLRLAREKLDIQVDREGFGKNCQTFWGLPLARQNTSRAQSCPLSEGAKVGTTEEKGPTDADPRHSNVEVF